MVATIALLIVGVMRHAVSGDECYIPILCDSPTIPAWVEVPAPQADQNGCVKELGNLLERVITLGARIASLQQQQQLSQAQTESKTDSSSTSTPDAHETVSSTSTKAMTMAAEVTSASLEISTNSSTSSEISSTTEHSIVVSTQVRLVGGGVPHEGRVEILHNGTWGTICDDYWSFADADVICRMLGYNIATAAPQQAKFGGGSGVIWIDDVACFGNETSIISCGHPGWGFNDCSHSEDASVVCSHKTAAEIWNSTTYKLPDWTVRLVNGTTRNEGRVEVMRNGVWGTICGNGWDENDGHVTCRMMGYQRASQIWTSAYLGRGKGPVWIASLYCHGTEANIGECQSDYYTCNHDQDAAVRCA